MKFDDFSVLDLKKHAKGVIKGYTAMKKADLVKHLKKQFSIKGGAIVRKAVGDTSSSPPPPSGRTSVGGGQKKVQFHGGSLEQSRNALKDALMKHMHLLQVVKTKSVGGQLPCSVTEKMKGLKMKGSGFFKGDSGTNVCSEDCYKPPECEKDRENAINFSADRIMRYPMQAKLAKCTKQARAKKGCPEKCVEGARDSGLQRIGQKIVDPMMKAHDLVLGAAAVASKPAFMTGCAAAAASVGGPVAGAAGAAACGEIYNKLVKKPGVEEYYLDKSGLSDSQIKIVRKMTDVGAKRATGGGAGEDPIDWEDIKWGSFKAQFDQYNATHENKFNDLGSFADYILANKQNFQQKTLKRARFYKNVLQKKKS